MDDDEYELLPHKEIAELKTQLEAYRKGPSASSQASMDHLSDSINTLINIFKEASTSMAIEDKQHDAIMNDIKAMSDKIDKGLDQNKKIAEGIVALADMVKELQQDMEELKKNMQPPPPPMMRQMQPPRMMPSQGMMGGTGNMPGMQGMQQPLPPLQSMDDMGLPPPPP